MKEIIDLEWSPEDAVAMMAGKGNYAIMSGKGTVARLRTSPEGNEISEVDAAALLAPLA